MLDFAGVPINELIDILSVDSPRFYSTRAAEDLDLAQPVVWAVIVPMYFHGERETLYTSMIAETS